MDTLLVAAAGGALVYFGYEWYTAGSSSPEPPSRLGRELNQAISDFQKWLPTKEEMDQGKIDFVKGFNELDATKEVGGFFNSLGAGLNGLFGKPSTPAVTANYDAAPPPPPTPSQPPSVTSTPPAPVPPHPNPPVRVQRPPALGTQLVNTFGGLLGLHL